MSASDYLEDKIQQHVFNLATFTPAASLYIALYTAAPNDAGGGTEVSGNAYARVQVTNDTTTWDISGATITNAIPITFAAPSPSTWGTVTHVGLLDAASSGNLYFWDPLVSAKTTAVGVALTFAAGDLSITLD